jgi:hypothetical protein
MSMTRSAVLAGRSARSVSNDARRSLMRPVP